MSISPISFPSIAVPAVSALVPGGSVAATTSAVAPSADASGFAKVLASSVDQVQTMQTKTDGLAVQAATGDLQNVQDYTIASTESGLATEILVAVRNKAVDAFNEIMKMPI